MESFLVFIVVTTAAALVTLAVATGLLVRWVQRRNRVSPRISTSAPIGWLWSPVRAARLHRRLQRAVTIARSCCGRLERARVQLLALLELVDDLERVAVAVDDRLVEASRAHRTVRARMLDDLERDVRQVEATAHHMLRTLDRWTIVTPEAPAAALGRIAERFGALDDAMRELDRIDQSCDAAVPRAAG